jgi:peroxiredoxin
MVRLIKKAGKASLHGKYLRAERPSFAMVPQLATGACTPRPKKLKNASEKIAAGTVKVIVVMMGPMALGRRCRNKILH